MTFVLVWGCPEPRCNAADEEVWESGTEPVIPENASDFHRLEMH